MKDVTVGPPAMYELMDVFKKQQPGMSWKAKECIENLRKVPKLVADEIMRNARDYNVM